MRISILPTDPGYEVWCGLLNRHLVKVYLAGSERKNVVTADEEHRMAVTYRLDANGDPVTKDGELVMEEFYGEVRIELPAAPDGSSVGQTWPFQVVP